MDSLVELIKAVKDLSPRHIFSLFAVGAGILLFDFYAGNRLGVHLPENVRLVLIYATVGLFFWGSASALFSLGENVSRKHSSKRGAKTSLNQAREKLRCLPIETLTWIALCSKHNLKSFWAPVDEPAVAFLAQKYWFEAGELPVRRVGIDFVYLFTFDDPEWQAITEEKEELAKVLQEAKKHPNGGPYVERCQHLLAQWSSPNNGF